MSTEPRISAAVGYRIEGAKAIDDEDGESPPIGELIDDVFDLSNQDSDYYRQHFLNQPHVNLLCSESPEGPYCISIKEQETELLALVQTQKGNKRLTLPAVDVPVSFWRRLFGLGPSRREMIRCLDPTVPFARLRVVDGIGQAIHDLLAKQAIKGLKFGVLYAADGQTKEDEMFANTKTSPEFEEFLDFLGDRIVLHGWDKFRGGLDVQNGSTGTHSVFTEYQNNPIMFHVSTLLPFHEQDKQQLERKRHIGNDIVIIVFQDGDTVFRPTTVSSRQIHVIFLIKATMKDNERYYSLAVISREEVAGFAPAIPEENAVYKKGPEFRELLYTKMLNAEQACYLAPILDSKLTRTRNALLQDLAQSNGA